VRRLVTATVKKWAQKQKLPDSALLEAIRDIELGRSAFSLGSGLYKVRIARSGQGKRGGYRTLIVYRAEVRAIVIFGYAKTDMDNIEADELTLFRKLAKDLLSLSDYDLQRAVDNHVMYELKDG
jgi:hypothetical protein